MMGEIIEGEMRLSEFGRIVSETWMDLPNHYKNVVLDAFVVMPNHVHGIVILNDDRVGAGSEPAPTRFIPVAFDSSDCPLRESPFKMRIPCK